MIGSAHRSHRLRQGVCVSQGGRNIVDPACLQVVCVEQAGMHRFVDVVVVHLWLGKQVSGQQGTQCSLEAIHRKPHLNDLV